MLTLMATCPFYANLGDWSSMSDADLHASLCHTELMRTVKS